jgi:hypothetical protein
MWQVVTTEEFKAWFASLSTEQRAAILRRTATLAEVGPALGRPIVDTITNSSIANLKELRCSQDGALRALFVFDPQRQAVFLIGGNKAEGSKWNAWYREYIPRAEAIYKSYLAQISKEEKGK